MPQRIMMREAGHPAQRLVRNQERQWQAHWQGRHHKTPWESKLSGDGADDPRGGALQATLQYRVDRAWRHDQSQRAQLANPSPSILSSSRRNSDGANGPSAHRFASSAWIGLDARTAGGWGRRKQTATERRSRSEWQAARKKNLGTE